MLDKLCLLISLIVVAALLAHEKRKAKHAEVINGDSKERGKQDIQSIESILDRLDHRHFKSLTSYIAPYSIRDGMTVYLTGRGKMGAGICLF